MSKKKETLQTKPSYFSYATFGLGGFADRVLNRVRSETYEVFSRKFPTGPDDKVLDVGVSAEDHPTSNFFEKRYPYTKMITAVGIEDYAYLEEIYPGMKFVKADGRNLPFKSNQFRLTFSHAVIEHTGSRDKQCNFIRELLRVSEAGVFLTTPNRWHPVELHTGLPLLHYFPLRISRLFYRILGKKFFSREENLNLLSTREIKSMLHSLGIENYQLTYIYWLGFRSNILISIFKEVQFDNGG